MNPDINHMTVLDGVFCIVDNDRVTFKSPGDYTTQQLEDLREAARLAKNLSVSMVCAKELTERPRRAAENRKNWKSRNA